MAKNVCGLQGAAMLAGFCHVLCSVLGAPARLALVALAGFMLAAGPLSYASAATAGGLDLAARNQCMACHQLDKRRVGPPFSAIAERFVGQPQAESLLARSIRQGSRGQWGAIPMPAQTRVTETDAHMLAQWILSLRDAQDRR